MILGITMNPDAEIHTLKEAAGLAEELGFRYFYLADQGLSRDVYVTLAALASSTTSLRLGPGVTHPYVRHPAATAVAVATLDELSGRRAFLGVGAGGSRALRPLNLSRTAPLTASKEMVEIARLLWSGSPATYNGRAFQLTNARLGFLCRPDIEVHWAARGPKMLKLGGHLADVVFLHGVPHEDVPRLAAWAREGAAEAGRQVRIHLAMAFVYDDHSLASARLRTAYRLVDMSEDARQRLGLSSRLVTDITQRVLSSDLQAAAQLVDDSVLRHFVVDLRQEGILDEIARLLGPIGPDGIVAEIPDPNAAHLALPAARHAIARLMATLQSLQAANTGQEVSHGSE